MRSFFIVIYYTIAQAVKKKSFWTINAILSVIIFLTMAFVSNIDFPSLSLNSSSDEKGILEITHDSAFPSTSYEQEIDIEKTKKRLPKVLIIDNTNMFGSYLYSLSKLKYNFIIDNNIEIETIKQEINSESLYAAVIIDEVNDSISFEYMVLNDLSYNNDDAKLISKLLKEIQATKILTELNASYENIESLNTPINYTVTALKDSTILNNATLLSLGLALILFFAIYLYSFSVSSSISSEKASRVIETLVASTSPKYVILGKTIAMGILGLLQLLFLGIVCIISYKFFISSNSVFLIELINSINITTPNIILVAIYFILGYTLFAFLNAITGATVSKPEDIPMANLPISFISVISLVLAFLSLILNQDLLNNFSTMFPFSSPFVMPGRILTGYAEFPEIFVSLSVLIFAVILLAFISIRIYSIAILHYGNRLKFKDLFNIFIKIK